MSFALCRAQFRTAKRAVYDGRGLDEMGGRSHEPSNGEINGPEGDAGIQGGEKSSFRPPPAGGAEESCGCACIHERLARFGWIPLRLGEAEPVGMTVTNAPKANARPMC